jgi:hypothetical protein
VRPYALRAQRVPPVSGWKRKSFASIGSVVYEEGDRWGVCTRPSALLMRSQPHGAAQFGTFSAQHGLGVAGTPRCGDIARPSRPGPGQTRSTQHEHVRWKAVMHEGA